MSKQARLGFVTLLLLALVAVVVVLSFLIIPALRMTERNSSAMQRTIDNALAASQAADEAQCQADHGEGTTTVALPDGSHRCRGPQGQPLSTLQQP